MIGPRLAAAGALGLGILTGTSVGLVRADRFSDHRPLCATCHHGARDLAELDVLPPHSTDFDASCHGCHVWPVRQYLEHVAGTLGLPEVGWIASVKNPVLGGQTCLECHMARGRGVLSCEQCHTRGTLDVRLDERCEACHDAHPLAPHDATECRSCHVEVYADRHGRAAELMREKLEGKEDWRRE